MAAAGVCGCALTF